MREHKGKSLVDFPLDFTVIDVETTGLDPRYDMILEVAALRVRDGSVVDRFVSFSKAPGFYQVPEFITEITGITTDMIESAPDEKNVLTDLHEFLGNDLLIGHNVNFDINFMYDGSARYGLVLENDFIDTLRLARRFFTQYDHHRLSEVCSYLDIPVGRVHRSEADTDLTLQCYLALKDRVLSEMSLSDFQQRFKGYSREKYKAYHNSLASVVAETSDFDESNPLYGKTVVFTGALSKMSRKEAFQLVTNLGGIPSDSLNKKTNYLVVGDEEFASSVKNGQTAKMIKAEAYRLKGLDIVTISEEVFFDMVFES